MAFTAMNAAWNYSGNITEKIRSANSLIALAAASFAAWLSFISWELTLAFILCLIVLGQYVPYKIGIQHDDAIAEKTEKFITFISKLLSPVTAVLIAISNVFLKIFRQKDRCGRGSLYRRRCHVHAESRQGVRRVQ